MPKLERHYRTVPLILARRKSEELYTGFVAAHRQKNVTPSIDQEPADGFLRRPGDHLQSYVLSKE